MELPDLLTEKDFFVGSDFMLEYKDRRIRSVILSYMDIFLYLGILFLFCIPIIFFIRKGKSKINPADAMH